MTIAFAYHLVAIKKLTAELENSKGTIRILDLEIDRLLAEDMSSELRQENEMLLHQEALLWTMIESRDQEIAELTNELEQLKAQIARPAEAQKTNRSADRPRYNLTDAERDLVERVVMAESGGESYQGQMLVCQCLLNACEIDDIRPAKAIKQYAYAKSRPEPSENVKRAVTAVFDEGERVTGEPIVYFYAPALTTSEFHESQEFVLTEGGHKFFCAR